MSADSAPERLSRLSAVVCTRGRPDLAARAVASLTEQRVSEVLVVDNAPDDDDASRLLRESFAGVRYVVEPIPGLDFARNRALSEATGDVVAFLDDDAVAAPGWADALAAVFESDARVGACTARVEALSVETPAQRIFEANGGYGRGLERIRLPRDASRPLHGRRAPLIAWAVSVGSGCSFALRRDLALDVGGFDVALDLGEALPGGGDHDMLWRVLQSGHDVVYEPEAVAYHEHRKEEAAVYAQLAGHQRGLVAFLAKTALTVRGRERASVLAFLIWRLLKPGVRLARRVAHRDPLPAAALWRMWGSALIGPAAYVRARRTASRRAAAVRGSLPAPEAGRFGPPERSRGAATWSGARRPSRPEAEWPRSSSSAPAEGSDLRGRDVPPPVSVVVCTKDRPEQLDECLAVLTRVAYPEYEVLVVDNGSRDERGRAIAERHGARALREARPGLNSARNRGVAEARHEVLAFIDDDVRVEPGWLRALGRAFVDPTVDAVTGLVLPLELETRAQRLFEAYGAGMSKGSVAKVFHRADLEVRELIAVQHVGVGANMAAKRSALIEVGGFDTTLGLGTPSDGAGDLDMFHRLLAAGKTIRYEPGAVVRHRHRKDMGELEAQIRANGRSFGVYLLKLLEKGTVPRHAVVLYALSSWAPWLLGRLSLGLLGRHRLPAGLLWAEVRGALSSPAAFRSTRATNAKERSPSVSSSRSAAPQSRCPGSTSIDPSGSRPNASK